jgi:hypothetical protein
VVARCWDMDHHALTSLWRRDDGRHGS